jgi:hypothetical protein
MRIARLVWIAGVGVLVSGCNCGPTTENPPQGDLTPDAGEGGLIDGGHVTESTFSSDDDGWTIVGDAQQSSKRPTYHADGGNPGGMISATDKTTGGIWYFVAPAKYLGDQSAFIGTWLKFDLAVNATPTRPADRIDIKLTAGSRSLAYDTPKNPVGGAWTSYAVPLSATGWRVGTLTGAAATEADFAAVMGSLTAIWIRGEYNVGADIGYLDNVQWGAGP